MKIDVYSTMYNEEKILPYWLRHYNMIADRIFVWDDDSTDRTREILSQNPKVTILAREKPGDDDNYFVNELFPQYEKLSRGQADWVMIADPDEFIYHPRLRQILEDEKGKGMDIIHCAGFTMISDHFPTNPGQIYDVVRTGLPDYFESKWAIHSPDIQIRFREGRHRAVDLYQYRGRVDYQSEIKLLHFRYLGRQETESRDRKNYEGYRRAHPEFKGVYRNNVPRALPNGKKGEIFAWLSSHKNEAFDVLEADISDLGSLAYQYGTDKCPQIRHHYTPVYHKLFRDRRDSVKKVLEIGVGNPEIMSHSRHYKTGASLYMWRDYFPNAQIFGADILAEMVFKDRRIETFQCDQTKKDDLENLIQKIGPDIDLVVDDGSHNPEDQIFTCFTLMPLLKKNVVYAIEDVGKTYIIDEIGKRYHTYYRRFPHKSEWGDRLVLIRNY